MESTDKYINDWREALTSIPYVVLKPDDELTGSTLIAGRFPSDLGELKSSSNEGWTGYFEFQSTADAERAEVGSIIASHKTPFFQGTWGQANDVIYRYIAKLKFPSPPSKIG